MRGDVMRILVLVLAAAGVLLGEDGFGYLSVLNDGRVVASDYRGTGLYLVSQDGLDSMGQPQFSRGRHATLWGQRFVLFKQIVPEGQIPAVYDIAAGRIHYLTDPHPSAGVPQPWGEALVVPVGRKIVLFHELTRLREFEISTSIQWIAVDSVHGRAAFIDDDGYIVLIDLRDGSREKSLPSLGYLPAAGISAGTRLARACSCR